MFLPPPVLAAERPVLPFRYLPPAATAVAALAPRACRWPLGEPGDADFGFCGGVRLLRGSYCACHARLARSRDVRANGRGGRA